MELTLRFLESIPETAKSVPQTLLSYVALSKSGTLSIVHTTLKHVIKRSFTSTLHSVPRLRQKNRRRCPNRTRIATTQRLRAA